jgi:hypothetical protein
MEAECYANIFPGPGVALPTELGLTLCELKNCLGMPLCAISQRDFQAPFSFLEDDVVDAFHEIRDEFNEKEKVALLVDSLGGDAKAAYQISRFLQTRCGGFVAIVPREAMSGATLLVLGAKKILMGHDAYLGPIDAQVFDLELERHTSVLNEVKALDQLQQFGMECFDQTMFLLVQRTGKSTDSLIPHALKYVADSMRPLLEKIDVIHYNERARILKVAEEYATRLLRVAAGLPICKPVMPISEERLPKEELIASHLVGEYPEHGFHIDAEEAQTIGLPIEPLPQEVGLLLDRLWHELDEINVLGLIKEGTDNGSAQPEGAEKTDSTSSEQSGGSQQSN